MKKLSRTVVREGGNPGCMEPNPYIDSRLRGNDGIK